jgi:hypothetical protein
MQRIPAVAGARVRRNLVGPASKLTATGRVSVRNQSMTAPIVDRQRA